MLNVIECDLISSMVYEKNFVNLNEREIKRNNSFKNIGCVKPLKDYPSYYISDEGKVYSDMRGKTVELKPWKTRLGYLMVGLCKDGKLYKKLVHRLVLSTFSPIPEMQEYQVNHRDENPLNNRLENLEWCTAKYNCNYGTHNEKLSKARKGKKCPWISLTKSKKVLQYDQNYNLIATYSSATEAGKALNVSQGTISTYCNSLKLYKNSYYFQYAANS